MTMFLDIAAEGQRGTTPFRGKDVDLVGLSSRQIAALLVNHETIQKFFEAGQANISLPTLVKLAPDAVAAAIAYGTGYDEAEDKAMFDKACARAAKLSAGEQYDLVRAIGDITFGERLNPFVKMMVARVESRVAQGVEARTRSTKSAKELKDSLRSDTTPEMFGATHHGNSPDSPA